MRVQCVILNICKPELWEINSGDGVRTVWKFLGNSADFVRIHMFIAMLWQKTHMWAFHGRLAIGALGNQTLARISLAHFCTKSLRAIGFVPFSCARRIKFIFNLREPHTWIETGLSLSPVFAPTLLAASTLTQPFINVVHYITFLFSFGLVVACILNLSLALLTHTPTFLYISAKTWRAHLHLHLHQDCRRQESRQGCRQRRRRRRRRRQRWGGIKQGDIAALLQTNIVTIAKDFRSVMSKSFRTILAAHDQYHQDIQWKVSDRISHDWNDRQLLYWRHWPKWQTHIFISCHPFGMNRLLLCRRSKPTCALLLIPASRLANVIPSIFNSALVTFAASGPSASSPPISYVFLSASFITRFTWDWSCVIVTSEHKCMSLYKAVVGTHATLEL